MDEEKNVQTTNAPLQSEQKETTPAQEDPSDRLTPDHPRFKEVLERAKQAEGKVSELETAMQQLKEQITTRQEETGDDELTVEEERALARIDRGLRSKGYLTQDDLAVERRSQEYARLAKEYNGSNGLPKFDPTEVEIYAKKNGFSNLEKAYKDLHFDAFVQYQARHSTPPPSSEKPTGADRQVANTEFNAEAIAAMSDEEYERNREKILAAMRSPNK